MRILVTGSRDWYDKTVIRNAISSVPVEEGEQVIVVHGGARGADYLAQECAYALGYIAERYDAEWNTYGKRAGYIRNKEMVEAGADICLAFIKNESKGATMCAKLAEDAGIPVKYWRV